MPGRGPENSDEDMVVSESPPSDVGGAGRGAGMQKHTSRKGKAIVTIKREDRDDVDRPASLAGTRRTTPRQKKPINRENVLSIFKAPKRQQVKIACINCKKGM